MAGLAVVVFSDLVDSTALLARLGDDRMEAVRRSYVEEVHGVVVAAEGRVVKTLGDGVMASFDSALGALRAAAGIQSAIERLDRTHGGLGLLGRVGVAAGEPIRDGDDLHGMPVVIAARLCAAASGGEVLAQELVRALVASRSAAAFDEAEGYDLKGVAEVVGAARLRWRELEQAEGPGVDRQRSGDAAGADDARIAVPLPRVLAAFAEEPLIGRDREIEELREATVPRAGRRAVLVLGEPGLGKTRHAAAVAADAHAEGAVVVLARCPPEPTVAFEPWVRAIGELALAGDAGWHRGLAEAAGVELAGLVPELGVAAPVADGLVGADTLVVAEGQRYRLLRGIGAALARAAGQAPLYVVLDDAHWCDPASAQALGHLLEGAPVERLVLVVTARQGELGRAHPVSRVLGDLRRTRDLSELRLVGLDAHGLAALVGARVGRAITPRLAARLQARTGGNPFFASELVQDLEERNVLRDDETVDALPVPAAVTDLVEERLKRLDATTERLLVAVAAIGPSAPVALAARVAGLDDAEAEGAVQAALSERLVEELAVARPTVGFPHALIREALVAHRDGATGARLHLAVAHALEREADVEPAELARHYGLAVPVVDAGVAIAAHLRASRTAGEAHDFEQATVHIRAALALMPEADAEGRSPLLLELGEQLTLAADMAAARAAFQAAADSARASGDVHMFARAALGFAGGDVGFGWEVGLDDISPPLLREAIAALGDDDPRLTQRLIIRLAFLQTFTDDEAEMRALVRHAAEIAEVLEDDEARSIALGTAFLAKVAHCYEGSNDLGPTIDWLGDYDGAMAKLAARTGRDDIHLRAILTDGFVAYACGRIDELDQALERAAKVAERLGSPRFAWEIDMGRGQRLLDRGDRAAGEALIRSAGTVLRRLRPDIHMGVQVAVLGFSEWIYGGNPTPLRLGYEAIEEVSVTGVVAAVTTMLAAFEGDHETARRRLRGLMAHELRGLRRPDLHLPTAVTMLALTATVVGDREAGARLRPLLEPLRPYLIQAGPVTCFGFLPGWVIGRLELLAGRVQPAVDELRAAVQRADACELAWLQGWARVDLALALARHGDVAAAATALSEGQQLAERFGLAWVAAQATSAQGEIDDHEPTPSERAGRGVRPLRAVAARTGRRTLAAMVRGLDDAALERRFSDPRRQRALLQASARSFQPAHADGFQGLIAYELTPYAIDPPPDAPWRWALAIDAHAGHARLIEPAPLNATTTLHFGLADWVRAMAGLQSPIHAMAAGRCSIEGDVLIAVQLEAMFGSR